MAIRRFDVRYKTLSTRSYLAVVFAMFHIDQLEGEHPDNQRVYFNKACDAGIIFG
jgi:hypothetical protein